MRFVTCIVRECQLRLFGHAVRFPDAGPAHLILSAREPHEWRRPMGRPRASWLQQSDRNLKEMGMGQASAWGMARRKPLEYRRKVDAAVLAPIPDLTSFKLMLNVLRFRSNTFSFDQAYESLCHAKGTRGVQMFSGELQWAKKWQVV